ncbi:MAG TPA: AraC family transcriptional regulator, partial [Candidatus Angelobacter sp.]|nr:AraC family transcriptional regulator [Candidatus Angelobacter sp.]
TGMLRRKAGMAVKNVLSMQSHTAFPDRKLNGADRVDPALSYVEANYAEKISMATAARLCHLSPFQFSRRFKMKNGLTFRDFVLRLRIERAAKLMKDSGVSVTEAAFGVGFNDLSHFARMFRRQMGVPPSLYRKESQPSQLPLFPTRRGGT